MKICLPITARPHLARMQYLIKELQKDFDLDVWEPKQQEGSMAINAIFYAIEFSNFLIGKDYDAIMIRGDRYEMLLLATIAVYKGFKVIHIEGGDMSGVIDNKVRHAVTHLSDFHFATNEESHKRLINMGIPLDRVWNFGSLDVEFASKVKPERLRQGNYILVAYHPIPDEDPKELDEALKSWKEESIIRIGSNTDYNQKYGKEEFLPQDFINVLRYAKCAVGNSSALIKEASILGTPVVLVGQRQNNRLMPKNVIQVPCETEPISLAIEYQMKHKPKIDTLYYQKGTSKKICQQLLKSLNQE